MIPPTTPAEGALVDEGHASPASGLASGFHR